MARTFGFHPDVVEDMDPEDVEDFKTISLWLIKNVGIDRELDRLWRLAV